MEYHFKNLPYSATTKDFVAKLDSIFGEGTVMSCEIKTQNGRSKGFGFFTVPDEIIGTKVLNYSESSGFFIGGRRITIKYSNRVVHKPKHEESEIYNITAYMGNLTSNHLLEYLWFEKVEMKMKYRDGDEEFTHLCLQINGSERDYKLEYPFRSFQDVTSCMVRSSKGILFQLYYPPRVYTRISTRQADYDILFEYLFTKDPPWSRTTDFTKYKAIGQSIAFCLAFHQNAEREINKVLRKLKDYSMGDYPPKFTKSIGLKEEGSRYEPSHHELVPVIASSRLNRMPLDMIFKVNYLVQHGYISPAGLSFEFYDLLSKISLEEGLASLAKFESFTTTCCDPATEIRKYFKMKRGLRKRSHAGPIQLEEGQVYMKRVMVTPTKVYFLGPDAEVSNRITRNFAAKIDRFLRVTFSDEDFDILQSGALTTTRSMQAQHEICKSEVYKRLMSVLENGVHVGELKYEFLAFSSSQLRENSVWMFAGDGETTAEGIRNWMGVFGGIRNVAKCAARMGQSFSTSTHTLDVPQHEVVNLPEVYLNDYCFSDGIGKISKQFAMVVARKCRSLKTVPSAFQIRYGGYKGVVAVDPRISSKLELRPSMSKFPSEQTGLDVLSWTKPIPCYLNRQIIILLSTLNIEDAAFEALQASVVRKLDNMLSDPITALEVLRSVHAGESHRVMTEMLRAGYLPNLEPYLSSLLRAFRANQLHLLRTKSRILVPRGRRLMGCLDETSGLYYGQCFVQVSWTAEAAAAEGMPPGMGLHNSAGVSGTECAFVVKGRVVVAKNPCLHPGDVIVLEAVDVPQLHHMVDCIVFPQRGLRPHPNECSGSDLDGDLYFVTWDNSLIPRVRYPAMDYTPPASKELDHPVTVEEIQTFFLDHMLNNSLGVISNAHLVMADSSMRKALDEKCIELAKLFSTAVDFPETGVAAILPFTHKPTSYPDFLEKNGKTSYVSQTILGKLYRSVKNIDTGITPCHGDLWEEYDSSLIVEGYEEYLDDASYHKCNYDAKLTGLLNHYDITEAEIMCGSITRLSRLYKKRQGDVKERILVAARALLKEARGWFDEECDDDTDAKASAWYFITYFPEFRRGLDRKEELLSFPWVVYDKLIHIRKSKKF